MLSPSALLLWTFGSFLDGLLLRASPGKDAAHGMIPFVTRKLVEIVVRLLQGDHRGP